MTTAVSKVSAEEFDQLLAQNMAEHKSLVTKTDSMSYGEAVLRLPFDPATLRPGGSISGPTMMALADACMYAVVMSVIGFEPLTVTTNLNINFLNKPRDCDLIAEGRLLKLGKTMAVIEVAIHSDHDSKLVAHVTGSYAIPPRD